MLTDFRKGIASFALVLFLLMGTVAAQEQPGIPLHFYGNVAINGVSAPDGVVVEARVSDSSVALTTTSGGTYGEASQFFVPDPKLTMNGKTIEFYVQNVKAAEYVFNILDNPVELDLSVAIANFCGDGNCESGESCSSCSKDCGSCNPPGGGTTTGGGSSGGGGGITPPEEEGPCVEDWICTDWTGCISGKKTRNCADVNRCGTTENRPVLNEECTVLGLCEAGETKCEGNNLMACSATGDSWVIIQECELGCTEKGCTQGGFSFTGMMSALPLLGGGLIVIIVIIMLIFYFVKIRK